MMPKPRGDGEEEGAVMRERVVGRIYYARNGVSKTDAPRG